MGYQGRVCSLIIGKPAAQMCHSSSALAAVAMTSMGLLFNWPVLTELPGQWNRKSLFHLSCSTPQTPCGVVGHVRKHQFPQTNRVSNKRGAYCATATTELDAFARICVKHCAHAGDPVTNPNTPCSLVRHVRKPTYRQTSKVSKACVTDASCATHLGAVQHASASDFSHEFCRADTASTLK